MRAEKKLERKWRKQIMQFTVLLDFDIARRCRNVDVFAWTFINSTLSHICRSTLVCLIFGRREARRREKNDLWVDLTCWSEWTKCGAKNWINSRWLQFQLLISPFHRSFLIFFYCVDRPPPYTWNSNEPQLPLSLCCCFIIISTCLVVLNM